MKNVQSRNPVLNFPALTHINTTLHSPLPSYKYYRITQSLLKSREPNYHIVQPAGESLVSTCCEEPRIVHIYNQATSTVWISDGFWIEIVQVRHEEEQTDGVLLEIVYMKDGLNERDGRARSFCSVEYYHINNILIIIISIHPIHCL